MDLGSIEFRKLRAMILGFRVLHLWIRGLGLVRL